MKNTQSRIAAVVMCGSIGIALFGRVDEAGAVGFRLPNQDPEGISRGNAFAATADNPSAIYYNPAGISQLDGTQVRAGLYFVSADTSFSGPQEKGKRMLRCRKCRSFTRSRVSRISHCLWDLVFTRPMACHWIGERTTHSEPRRRMASCSMRAPIRSSPGKFCRRYRWPSGQHLITRRRSWSKACRW